MGLAILSSVERLSFSRRLKLNYYYGKGVQKKCPLLGGCPFLGGSFIGGSTVLSQCYISSVETELRITIFQAYFWLSLFEAHHVGIYLQCSMLCLKVLENVKSCTCHRQVTCRQCSIFITVLAHERDLIS